MKQLKKLSVLMLLLASLFMTGCDAQQILDVITKIADGVQQAMPAIKEIVNAFDGVMNTNNAPADDAPAVANNNEQAAANNANVITIDPDRENVGNVNRANAPARPAATAAAAVSAQASKIASSIRSLVGSTRFRSSAVGGGNLACAQVISTALKNAGALSRVSLNCDQVVSDLKAAGWRRATVPPYRDGDVVTWTTSRGPGRHIGIIVKSGSTFKAISNSSSQLTPRVHEINYLPITQVLRKV